MIQQIARIEWKNILELSSRICIAILCAYTLFLVPQNLTAKYLRRGLKRLVPVAS